MIKTIIKQGNVNTSRREEMETSPLRLQTPQKNGQSNIRS